MQIDTNMKTKFLRNALPYIVVALFLIFVVFWRDLKSTWNFLTWNSDKQETITNEAIVNKDISICNSLPAIMIGDDPSYPRQRCVDAVKGTTK